jgi:hypothetical protein
MRELSIPEQQTFGADARLHEISGLPIEQGSGALPADAQAIEHLKTFWQWRNALIAKQRDLTDSIAAERAARTVGPAGSRVLPRDVTALQKSLAAVTAEKEALDLRIADVTVKLLDGGIIEKYRGKPVADATREHMEAVLPS